MRGMKMLEFLLFCFIGVAVFVLSWTVLTEIFKIGD
jgi:hypothetical protein